jgi:predicted nucleic acid-binding protein
MPRPVLIDTSAWIEAMREHGDEAYRDRVERILLEGRARFCDVVCLELWNGVRAGAERRWLQELEAVIETVPTDEAVWNEARELANACRESGLTLPATDLLVAACARIHTLDLLHRDRHFDQLAKLQPKE